MIIVNSNNGKYTISSNKSQITITVLAGEPSKDEMVLAAHNTEGYSKKIVIRTAVINH